jgi:hypothetical protein
MAGLSYRIARRNAALAGVALATLLAHLALLDALAQVAPQRMSAARDRTAAMATRWVEPVRALVVEAPPSEHIEPPAPLRVAPLAPLALPAPRVARPAPQPARAVELREAVAPSADIALAVAKANESGAALPVYATRIPSSFRFGYEMSRGMISGHGELALQITADGYEARLQGSVAGFTVLDWRSQGSIDAAGFAPLRFVDQRRGRSAQAANFQRAAGKITYSGTQAEVPLPPGAQDRLSWMLQLAAIARARPERLSEGARITLFVSGARGDADAWTFQVGARAPLDTPAGTVQAIPLAREPRKDYDTRAQVWLDPARQYLPVKARLASSREGGEALELALEEVQTPP